MADGAQKDWCELCLAVANETDPKKLSLLIQQLIEALDKGERSWRRTVPPSDAIETHRKVDSERGKEVFYG